jgi:hypothetical protein
MRFENSAAKSDIDCALAQETPRSLRHTTRNNKTFHEGSPLADAEQHFVDLTRAKINGAQLPRFCSGIRRGDLPEPAEIVSRLSSARPHCTASDQERERPDGFLSALVKEETSI